MHTTARFALAIALCICTSAWGQTTSTAAPTATPVYPANTKPPAHAVVWQDGRAAPVTQTGINAFSVQLRNAAFAITIPNRDPSGQPVKPSQALIGVCLSRDPALFRGIATGRSVGVMPCLNGATTLARMETETAETMQLAVGDGQEDGEAHYLYDDQNTVFSPGMSTLHVRSILDLQRVGVSCTGKGYSNCRDTLQPQPFPGGTLHAVVYTDLNENRLADAGEFWLLTLRLDGPPPPATAVTVKPPPEPVWGPLGRPLARLNGSDVLYLADAQAEMRRAPQVRGDRLSKALIRLVEQLLAAQEATRLGLWAGLSPALASSPDVGARAADRLRGAQLFAQHVGAAVAPPAEDQIQAFYDAWPELFSQRKVYQMEEFVPEPGHMHAAGLQLEPSAVRSPISMAAYLTHNAVPYKRNTTTIAADNIDMKYLRELARLPHGAGLALDYNDRAIGLFVRDSTLQPVTLEAARPAIAGSLLKTARRAAVDLAIQRLATSAKFEQYGPSRKQPAAASARTGPAQ